jgi:cation diffusion facilitator CzcD-associated flavoprotein CzcO
MRLGGAGLSCARGARVLRPQGFRAGVAAGGVINVSKERVMSQSNGRALRIVVIGAGMAGILTAIKLREAGYTDYVIYEKTDAPRWHLAREHLSRRGLRRAGPSATPIPSSPTPTGARPSRRARRFRPISKASRASTACTDDALQRPRSRSCVFRERALAAQDLQGREDVADVVIAATGVLHYPAIADIAGLDSFRRRLLPQRALGSRACRWKASAWA